MNQDLESIRKRVEAYLQSSKRGSSTGDQDINAALAEFSTVLEELRVADEELRVQNTELIAGRQALEEERRRYQELFDLAPDAYLVSDQAGIVTEANRAALLLLNIDYPFLIGKPLASLVPDADRKMFRGVLNQLDRTLDMELILKRRGAPDFEAAVRVAQILAANGEVKGFRWVIRDIDHQKRLARELNASQDRFQKIFEHATAGIALLQADGRIVDCNPAFQNLLGRPLAELQRTPLARFVSPEDQPVFEEQFGRLWEAGLENARFELRFVGSDGTQFWALVSLSAILPVAEGEYYGIAFIDDITAQKQLAAERTEAHHRIIDGVESERAQLARELHDNPLQTLYAALYQLVNLEGEELAEEKRQAIDHLRGLIRKAINALRVISGELRSPSLKAFGIKKGIRAYVDQFVDLNPGIDVQLHMEGDSYQPPERVALALYRIVQECLANVLRHSNATLVNITYLTAKGQIELRIEDNGQGFTPPANLVDLMRNGHYGLAGIAERVEMIGGKLTIESTPGRGSTIDVSVQL